MINNYIIVEVPVTWQDELPGRAVGKYYITTKYTSFVHKSVFIFWHAIL